MMPTKSEMVQQLRGRLGLSRHESTDNLEADWERALDYATPQPPPEGQPSERVWTAGDDAGLARLEAYVAARPEARDAAWAANRLRVLRGQFTEGGGG